MYTSSAQQQSFTRLKRRVIQDGRIVSQQQRRRLSRGKDNEQTSPLLCSAMPGPHMAVAVSHLVGFFSKNLLMAKLVTAVRLLLLVQCLMAAYFALQPPPPPLLVDIQKNERKKASKQARRRKASKQAEKVLDMNKMLEHGSKQCKNIVSVYGPEARLFVSVRLLSHDCCRTIAAAAVVATAR